MTEGRWFYSGTVRRKNGALQQFLSFLRRLCFLLKVGLCLQNWRYSCETYEIHLSKGVVSANRARFHDDIDDFMEDNHHRHIEKATDTYRIRGILKKKSFVKKKR